MSIYLQMYSVQFLPPQGNSPAHWYYAPAPGTLSLASTDCEITVDTDFASGVLVFNLQALSQSLEGLIFNINSTAISWTSISNGISTSISQPDGVTVNYSFDKTVLVITDDNDNTDSYGFTFQVTYNGTNYTSSDPVIVNKDVGTGDLDRCRFRVRIPGLASAVETRELIAVGETMGS